MVVLASADLVALALGQNKMKPSDRFPLHTTSVAADCPSPVLGRDEHIAGPFLAALALEVEGHKAGLDVPASADRDAACAVLEGVVVAAAPTPAADAWPLFGSDSFAAAFEDRELVLDEAFEVASPSASLRAFEIFAGQDRWAVADPSSWRAYAGGERRSKSCITAVGHRPSNRLALRIMLHLHSRPIHLAFHPLRRTISHRRLLFATLK